METSPSCFFVDDLCWYFGNFSQLFPLPNEQEFCFDYNNISIISTTLYSSRNINGSMDCLIHKHGTHKPLSWIQTLRGNLWNLGRFIN